jgi:hypothetical protein
VELEPRYQQDRSALSLLYIRSAQGALVPLDSVARLSAAAGPLTVNHLGQLPAVTLSFNLKPGVSLGDAIACARDHVGGEPFAVLLGDTVMGYRTPVARQLMAVFERYQESVVAVEAVERSKISRYGCIAGRRVANGLYLLQALLPGRKICLACLRYRRLNSNGGILTGGIQLTEHHISCTTGLDHSENGLSFPSWERT